MALSLSAIREGIAATVRDGVPSTVNCYAYPPASPAFPCFVLRPAEDWMVPTESYGDEVAVTLNWDLLFGESARGEDAMRFLDVVVIDAISALEEKTSDGSLDGEAHDVIVGPVTMRGPSELDSNVWVASIRLSVLTSRPRR